MGRRRRTRLGLSLAALGLFVLALAAPTVLAADRSVAIRDFQFAPKTLEARVGDVVTWTNRDSVAHSATARGGTFDTGLIQPGESGSIRFTIGGVYRYICTPHPNMTGTVIVRAASGGLPAPNTDTTAVVDAGSPEGSPLPGLAVVGGLAYLVAMRVLRRRETA
jgi:plastocyanin